MKNRSVTVLALLAANDRFGQCAVHRTVLVKQAFLAETLHPLYEQWYRTFSFVRYKYGPYDRDIFQRLDTLIFNGLVEVVSAERRGTFLEARYRITAAGHDVLKRIEAVSITSLANDLIWALQTLGVDQATGICKLVYQEADFIKIFTDELKRGVSADVKTPLPSVMAADSETFALLATLRSVSELYDRSKFSFGHREVVRLFLRSLASQIPRAQTR